MEQPPLPGESRKKNGSKEKSKRMPSPQDLVSHYEKQGMETREASLKVIQDLQGALFKVITTGSRKSDPAGNDTASAKLDAIYARMVQLEMKVDSKPSFPQALGLGVASAGIWSSAVQIWNSVRRATSSSN